MSTSSRMWLCAVVLLAACGGGAPDADGGACAPGTASCTCTASGECGAGLTCDDGLCRSQESVYLAVTDPNARSCEAIVFEEGAEVFGVDFGDDVRGTNVREA